MGEIKQAYIAELEQRLNDWQVDMRKLQVRLDKANLETGHSLTIKMHKLRKKCDDTTAKLQVLREVDHDDWDKIKKELEKAWRKMSKSMHKIGKALEHQWDEKTD